MPPVIGPAIATADFFMTLEKNKCAPSQVWEGGGLLLSESLTRIKRIIRNIEKTVPE